MDIINHIQQHLQINQCDTVYVLVGGERNLRTRIRFRIHYDVTSNVYHLQHMLDLTWVDVRQCCSFADLAVLLMHYIAEYSWVEDEQGHILYVVPGKHCELIHPSHR